MADSRPSKKARVFEEEDSNSDMDFDDDEMEPEQYQPLPQTHTSDEVDVEQIADQNIVMLQQKEQLTQLLRQDPENVQLRAMLAQINKGLEMLSDVQETKEVRQFGTVQMYNVKKGFGFILPDGNEPVPSEDGRGDKGLFCHKSQIRVRSGTPFLVENSRVSFVIVRQADGRMIVEKVGDLEGEPLPSLEDTQSIDISWSTDTTKGKKDAQEDRYSEGLFMGDLGMYFGVFDGHGGWQCAEYVMRNLHKNIRVQFEQQRGDTSLKAVKKSISEGFKVTDANFLQKAFREKQLSEQGTTALCLFFLGSKYPSPTEEGDVTVVVANLGDCRAVLCRSGTALRLSDDHKPNRADERIRIQAAGGAVVKVGEVSRVTTAAGERILSGAMQVRPNKPMPRALAVSRSIGDSDLKSGGEKGAALVSSEPEITSMALTANDAFIVLACDGVWDVLTDQEVIEVAKPHFGQQKGPDAPKTAEISAATAVVQAAVAKGSEDNITVIVIEFDWIVAQNRAAELTALIESKEVKVGATEDQIDDLYGD